LAPILAIRGGTIAVGRRNELPEAQVMLASALVLVRL
jgi:hypothetical protein